MNKYQKRVFSQQHYTMNVKIYLKTTGFILEIRRIYGKNYEMMWEKF
jgi:hypothetical protein